jgi:hypothetical protein
MEKNSPQKKIIRYLFSRKEIHLIKKILHKKEIEHGR